MGSIQLDCPLCCGEKFASQQALKYHLLSMTVNLYCPVCNDLCDGIQQLADHLDTDCKNKKNQSSSLDLLNLKQEPVENECENLLEKTLLDENDKVNESNNQNSEVCHSETTNNSDMMKIIDSNNIMNGNIDSKFESSVREESNILITQTDNENTVLLTTENNEDSEMQVIEIPDNGDRQELYNCSSCGVSFISIMDHIQQYHDGQEVVVEMVDSETAETQNSQEAIITYHDKEVLQEDHLEDVDESEISEDSEEVDIKYPQILNTLKQEDCIDKDGRLYTRKVVQIEKFWDSTGQKGSRVNLNRRQPICESYTIDDEGNFVKVEKTDVDEEKTVDQLRKIVKLFTCSRCKMQFSKISQFNKHTCDPERASDYRCSHCDASFSNPKSLCAHMKVHKTLRVEEPPAVAPFLCVNCDTVFPTNKSLRLHQRMHEPIKAKEIEAPVEYGITGEFVSLDPTKPREMFICEVCHKTYDKGYEAVHMSTHSGGNDHHCNICNRKFFTAENLEMHMRVHNGGKPFSCSYCKASFDDNSKLAEHMEVHSKDRPYQCGYCGRKFARPHEKVKHERIHTGEKPHECEICGKTFRVSYCLTLHMRTHTGVRPYVCKHCGKRFKAHSVYNHHLLTHSDVRNYKCPYCPKAFKTGVQLAGHKNSHTKPFSCTECNRPFASLYAVRAHMESHRRENNLKFSCYLCGASYARNFALRDHIREVHDNSVMIVNGNDINVSDKLGLVDLEGLKATTSILPENDDETEIALNRLQEDIDEDDL